MRKMKIVTDSSANVLGILGIDYAFAPLKIYSSEKEFIDNKNLDVNEMINYFDTYKGKSKTSCPSPQDWLEAFGDADDIFCITITGKLSGSYNSACAAKKVYESTYSNKQICVIDSLSTGPEMELIINKINELALIGKSFEEICLFLPKYMKKTGLIFMLESMKNFAANGRVSPAVAKIAGLLGIRIIGTAGENGELNSLNKCRGESHCINTIISDLTKLGLSTGKVIISHCKNLNLATKIKEILLSTFPTLQIKISECRGLCSYYAEKGGLLIGFEKN